MIIRKLTILLVMANAAAFFLIAGGVVQVYGISPQTGVNDQVEQTNESAQNIEDDQSVIQSVVGTALTAMNALTDLVRAPFAAPTLALNLGVPGFVVGFIFAPMYIAVAIDLISVIRGMEIR